jgi:putative lipoprotein
MCAACALAVALALSPVRAHAQTTDPWFSADKALHFSLSAALGAGGYGLGAACFDDPWPRIVAGVSIGLGAGVAKELLDLAGYGEPSWRDLAWDALGTGVGVTLAWLVDRSLQRRPSSAQPRARNISLFARGAFFLLSW